MAIKFLPGDYIQRKSASPVRGAIKMHVDGVTSADDAIDEAQTAYPVLPGTAQPFTAESAVFDGFSACNLRRYVVTLQYDEESASGGGGGFDDAITLTAGMFRFQTYMDSGTGTPAAGNPPIGIFIPTADNSTANAALTGPPGSNMSLYERQPIPVSLDFPEWRVVVPVTSNSELVTWSTGLAGKLNSNSFVIGPYTFAAQTLLHVGLSERAVRTGVATYVFTDRIEFIYRPVSPFFRAVKFLPATISLEAFIPYGTAAFTDPPIT